MNYDGLHRSLLQTDEPRAGFHMPRQSGSSGKKMVGVPGVKTTLQSGCHQIEIQSWDLLHVQKRHSIIIRGHTACHPAVDKSCGIKQRSQIGLALVGAEGVEASKVPGACTPVRKESSAEIGSDILKRRPYWVDSLPLDEGHGVIQIIDTIKGRKTPDSELAI